MLQIHRPRLAQATVATAAVSLAVALCAVTPADAAPTGASRPVHATNPSIDSTTSRAASKLPTVPGRYVVTLKKKPAATYTGGIAGIGRTKPAAGHKLAVRSANTVKLRRYLRSQQSGVAAAVDVKPIQQYTVTLDGFAAKLTSGQIGKLRKNPSVAAVVPDTLHYVQNDQVDYDFLHLSGSKGVWQQVADASGSGAAKTAGQGVVVGVIDTGIWPESKSFAGSKLTSSFDAAHPMRAYRDGDTIVEHKLNGGTFTGTCETGEQFTASACNTKIIGARYFDDGFRTFTDDGKLATAPGEYASPRDSEGHGTHTASEAAGNNGVQATVDGRNLGKISGVAPGASIAVYKALWTGPVNGTNQSGGTTSDLVAAADAAVSDGVDVINYSVGGIVESSPTDPIQQSFLAAASAGVLVSAAGGNSGPEASTLDNTSPWIVTAAASTLAPYFGSITLGNGKKYTGSSNTVTTALGPKPLVLAKNVALSTADPADAALCTPNTLDPAKTAGKIVVCDRGVIARTEKSFEVKRAGGVGVVLANVTDLETDADLHAVPTVHLNVPAADDVRAYAAKPGATVTLEPGNTTGATSPYPQVAPFSSRGPSLDNPDIIKPDVAAPGVAILAAVSPPNNHGHSFEFESGTSMAAPHVAGLAALLLATNPTFTPAEVKSALMTTAGKVYNPDGSIDNDVFDHGSGQVDPTKLLNPGLVYNAGDDDWLSYLEGLGVKTGTGAKPVPAWNFNTPSFGSGHLVGTRTFTRTVTATGPGIFRATASVPGMTATVRPSILSFQAAGDTKTFKLTLTQTSAPSGKLATGALTWTGNNITVRSPIAVTPFEADAPKVVHGTGAAGSVNYTVNDSAGNLPVQAYGLTSTTPKKFVVDADKVSAANQYIPFTVTSATKAVDIHIASNTEDAEYCGLISPATPAELKAGLGDIVPGTSSCNQVRSQDKHGFADIVETDLLAPGTYTLLVGPVANAPGTKSTTLSVELNVIDDTLGSLTATPSVGAPFPGLSFPVTASWTDAPAHRRSVGFVQYGNRVGTVVEVDN